MHLDPAHCFRQQNLFEGSGEVRVWDLLRAVQLAPFAAVLWCELEGLGHVGPHRQQEHPELVICLEGSGVATVGGRCLTMEPGSIAALAFGEVLEIKNSTKEPLRYLIVKANAAPPTA